MILSFRTDMPQQTVYTHITPRSSLIRVHTVCHSLCIFCQDIDCYSTCSHCRTSSVMISRRGMALLSLRRNISLTIERRFHMPSGSLPLRGRSKLCHSAAAGGAVAVRKFTSLKTTQYTYFITWDKESKTIFHWIVHKSRNLSHIHSGRIQHPLYFSTAKESKKWLIVSLFASS